MTGLVEDRLVDRCEHLRQEAELSAGVGRILGPHVVGGEDLDPRGDGVFHHRALTIWADLSQVRWSRAVIATVILGQAWGYITGAELGLLSPPEHEKRERDSTVTEPRLE